MPPLRVLLVGYGFRGRQWARTCAGRSDLEVRGIVDPSPAAAEAATAAGLRAWPLLGDALSEGRAEAAIVASPARKHLPHGVACLEAGVAVLMEKPLATSLADAVVLHQAAGSAGRPLLVGQNYRSRPREQALRSLVSGGAIGRTRRTSIRVQRPALPVSYPPEVAHPPLWESVIHYLDLLRTRQPADPITVAAELEDRPTGWHAKIRLDWSNGARALVEQTDGSEDPRIHEFIRGTRGFVYAGTERAFVVGRGVRQLGWASGNDTEGVLLDAMVRALDGNRTEFDATDNLKTIALVEAVQRASIEARPVRLEEVWNPALDIPVSQFDD